MAPGCTNSVFVVPQSQSDSAAPDKKFEVYSGACNHFSVRPGQPESPLVEWLSADRLRITFPIGSYNQSFRLKNVDASQNVTVEFVITE